ncbi:MAG: hypothetical protein NC402_05035 [Prevotella sp.]|nr:hypothetical protein [Prevotella sp.]MCM1074135.1 hypothetical protein [Ruminococcus sp.]
MMKSKTIYMAAASAMLAAAVGCSSTRQQTVETGQSKLTQIPVIGSSVNVIPKAIVYQTTGDNAMDLVPITLSADGKSVVSYPAPSDLNEGQTPINLGDGWWLDRRGIGPNTVFTTYTYEQYAAMKQAPSPKELLEHIDKNVRISRMVQLPITINEADSDPAVVRAYTEGGFVDCKEIIIK